MKHAFEALQKQVQVMQKLASPVYSELPEEAEKALWAQAEQNVPNPGIPSRFSDEVKEIAYPLAGLGAGLAGYRVTAPLLDRAVTKFAPTHAANPRSALNLAAVGVPALLPLAGMYGGIKASDANQKRNNAARWKHVDHVEQAYYDLREKMASEFEGLMEQASAMTKLATNLSPSDEPSVMGHALTGAGIGAGLGSAGAYVANTIRNRPFTFGQLGTAGGIGALLGGSAGGMVGRIKNDMHAATTNPKLFDQNILNETERLRTQWKKQDEADDAAWQAFNQKHGQQYKQMFKQWYNHPKTIELMDNMQAAHQSGNQQAIRDASAAYYAHEDQFTRHPIVQQYLSLPYAQLFD